jgi:predicted DNA-binding protein (UPF0251 family)
MTRPHNKREISGKPQVSYFKPNGICASELEQVELSLDEWEALRLFNKENLNQTEGAEKMKISQSTFQRILCSGRKKLALAVLDGKAIKIQAK